MKANYSKLFTKFAGIMGVTGVSLLISLPSEAKDLLNPHPSIFNEAAYNRSQPIQADSQSTSTEQALETQKNHIKPKQLVVQRGGRTLNPRPSIFNEPPYNRGTAPGESTPIPTPRTRPTKPGTVIPTIPGSVKPPTTAPTRIPPAAGTGETKNLVALAEANGSFKTLIKALKAAGLTETLQGPGPFTIFAPTDAAFAKLPQDALRDLLKPENKEVLVKVLTYHVVRGKVLSSDLKSGQVTSLQGDPITVKVDPATGVLVNDANVTKADIQGSNGVIHQIDNLILPPSL
ncbi:beta-Ig-H3/fasciclin [Cylindrospermum sp. NIES-4074]|nr:beta-Ig-H3/fasciclin [Cylindrospermum sp. NIES-4074]